MKIVITGANGYIGARLSQYLSGKGHDIIAACYPSIPKIGEWGNNFLDLISGDIREQKTIEQIAGFQAEALIHLVSLDHHDSEKEQNYVSQTNVMPTWNLLKECTAAGLSKFFYFSTIHVYGKNLIGRIDENQKPTPYNVYGLTHYMSEEICNYYNRKTNTQCTNIRLSNSYGEPVFPDANCWELIINDLCKSAYLNKEIRLKSDGTAVRDFVHYSDICKGINQLLTRGEPINKEMNTILFSSGKSINMLEAAKTVQAVYLNRFGKKIPIFINNKEPWQGEPPANMSHANVISNDVAKSLAIVFKKKIEAGILDLFDYLETTLCQK